MKPTILHRAKKRRHERGATVFVVVLVLGLLTGIGLFAAQAASIATSTTGAARVSTQSRYSAEASMNSVMAKLSRDLGSHVANVLRRLLRVAHFHGARPRLIGATATIGNPGEFVRRLNRLLVQLMQ